MLAAETAVSGAARSFDQLFSYSVPDGMTVTPGCRVLVPFGRSNKRRIGVVMSLSETDDTPGRKLKPLADVIDSEPVVSEELLSLAVYLREQTFCTYFDAVKAMLPPGMGVRTKEKFTLQNIAEPEKYAGGSVSEEAMQLYESLRYSEGSRELTELISNYIVDNGRLLVDELCEAGLIVSNNAFRQNVGTASVKMVRLSEEYLESPDSFRLTPKQKKAAQFLSEYGEASVKEAAYMCGVTDTVIKRLAAAGAAEEFEQETFRRAEPDITTDGEDITRPEDIQLTDEQQNARDTVFSQLQRHEPAAFLLHGVTGSGKTSVFERLIYDTVSMGRQALLLVPEIGLTPQVLRRFRLLFGERVAVIHSGLTLGQRLDEHRRIRQGLADIVIGTRSAVFAPLDNIGLIVIDEEGERSYKSDSSPRYLAHDAAKQRCRYHSAVLLLASATPSIESYYLAQRGAYRLLEMRHRYSTAPLPEVTIVDMNEERFGGNPSEFSRKLVGEIKRNLDSGEQSILLLNRRGFHTIISCCGCGKPVYCPNCSVPLTYHKKNNKMLCHYCGYISDPVTKCPECGGSKLTSMGFGTQRLEEELAALFPEARILRMDADTTFSRSSYEKNFSAFRRGEYDIMVGTQMIGKGLDFPNVTLVGVLSVDKALYAGDFRSYERTFSLITQVVGRSGRGQIPGRAVLQTFMPEHYVMNLAAAQDYEGFYREEIAIRRAMTFPPICDMCVFGFSGEDEFRVKAGAEAVLGLMDRYLRKNVPHSPVRLLGPVRCSYGKIGGKYRWRIIVKCKNTAEIRTFVSEMLKEAGGLREMNKVSLYADMNGDTGV
ncbi:MAG: primosomal protein N' [Ruminococcus sp.]|nr:primosomal protein N' [Ruminococcus sp.]